MTGDHRTEWTPSFHIYPNGIFEFYDYYFSFFVFFSSVVELNHLLQSITTTNTHNHTTTEQKSIHFWSEHNSSCSIRWYRIDSAGAIAIIIFKYEKILSAHSI